MSKLYESINKGFNRRYLKEDASHKLTESTIEDLDTNNDNPFYFVTSEDDSSELLFLKTSVLGTWIAYDFSDATLYPNMQKCKMAIKDYIDTLLEDDSYGDGDEGYEVGDFGITFKIYKVSPVSTMNA